MKTLNRLAAIGADRCLLWVDRVSGLRAVAVIDDLGGGISAGGIRTGRYASLEEAVAEAAGLARAMTYKCALAHLRAGGCKIVVLDHEGLTREAAFRRLGELVDELGGLIHTAGDLGTTADDLRHAAERSRFVHAEEQALSQGVARGLAGCVKSWCAHRGGNHPDRLDGLRVAIQGCGSIGAAVASALHDLGADLVVSDLDSSRAAAVAKGTGAAIVSPEALLRAEVDIVAPCARGGVIHRSVVPDLHARAVIGAANNILRDVETGRALVARDIDFIPDVIASAGGVIEGLARAVMGVDDPGPLIDGLAGTALEVLQLAQRSRRPPGEIAIELAEERLAGR